MTSSAPSSHQGVSSLLIEKKVGIKSRLLLWSICSFVVVMLIWSANAQVDELVRGGGKVIPSKQLQVVQNLEGGILSELYIAEGERVKSGQVLLKIDDTQFESTYQESQSALLALLTRVERLRAEAAGKEFVTFEDELVQKTPDLVREQERLFNRRVEQLDVTVSVIGEQVKQQEQVLAQATFDYQQAIDEKKLAEKEYEILKPLFSEGVVSEVELLRTERSVLMASGEASSIYFRLPQIQAAIDEFKNRQKQLELTFKSEAQQALNLSLAELVLLQKGSGAIRDRVQRTHVRSPVNGTIKQLMVNTIGGVLKPGMDLVSIVPIEDSLLIEAKIRPADIARLYPGQRAVVKFTAYDFTIYGGLDAELIHISADSITDDQGESYYLVRVKTTLNNLGTAKRPLPIIPGMVAQIDILTGKKTLLNYLLKPILKAKQVALTER